MPRRAVTELAETDDGFKLAAKVRRLMIERGKPALILVNGKPAIEDLEVIESERVSLTPIHYESVDVPAPGKKQKRRWHKQGHYTANGLQIPVVGFRFLRAQFRQYSNAEFLQFEAHNQRFLRTSINPYMDVESDVDV